VPVTTWSASETLRMKQRKQKKQRRTPTVYQASSEVRKQAL
jgi:hypothetical protein